MARVHLIHGFNVSDGGEKSVLQLVPALMTYNLDFVSHNYGWTGPLLLRRKNLQTVAELLPKIEPGDVLIGHSNGCLICWELVDAGAPVSAVVCIQPAMRRDAKWPDHVKVMCLYNKRDVAVAFGRMWGRFATRVRPWKNRHGWGAAGRHGFTLNEPNVLNVETCRYYGKAAACGHSALFRKQKARDFWAEYIARWVKNRILEGERHAVTV